MQQLAAWTENTAAGCRISHRWRAVALFACRMCAKPVAELRAHSQQSRSTSLTLPCMATAERKINLSSFCANWRQQMAREMNNFSQKRACSVWIQTLSCWANKSTSRPWARLITTRIVQMHLSIIKHARIYNHTCRKQTLYFPRMQWTIITRHKRWMLEFSVARSLNAYFKVERECFGFFFSLYRWKLNERHLVR